ncbi:MAG TPA: sigma-54 dependent transcriptional regulator [Bryobacteraceae bacterium]|jgi:transcriptional regulator with PAS, ATPase and Fis domain|nr:sigma-54 dependent transcriptional regulator [Bryobacteraceae bacterium]
MPAVSETETFLGMAAVVASQPMHEILDLVRRVAQTNVTVLIGGESGSGKEVVARALHHHSLRATKPWVDVSCAALPDNLIESELFGYDKGAFSGADSAKPGLFELAHQGTLFLDEIGELEPRMQVKLLRVLDGVPYYRLGGVRKITTDVRIIAATNRDLAEMVEDGKFRGDLYHRIGQITIHVPPLRERIEDIIPLAEHFLHQHNPELFLSATAQEALRSYRWPGNIRELRNVLTRAAVLSRGLEIRRTDLPPEIQNGQYSAPQTTAAVDLDGMERRMILQALAETQGHHSRAAQRLGISRRTLSRKLKSYAMEDAQSYAS